MSKETEIALARLGGALGAVAAMKKKPESSDVEWLRDTAALYGAKLTAERCARLNAVADELGKLEARLASREKALQAISGLINIELLSNAR